MTPPDRPRAGRRETRIWFATYEPGVRIPRALFAAEADARNFAEREMGQYHLECIEVATPAPQAAPTTGRKGTR